MDAGEDKPLSGAELNYSTFDGARDAAGNSGDGAGNSSGDAGVTDGIIGGVVETRDAELSKNVDGNESGTNDVQSPVDDRANAKRWVE